LTEVEEIVIVAADLTSLNANTCVVERGKRRQGLREESGLHLFRDFELLGSATFRFELFGQRAPLCVERLAHFIEAHQRKDIPVHIFEAREDSSPNRILLSKQHR